MVMPNKQECDPKGNMPSRRGFLRVAGMSTLAFSSSPAPGKDGPVKTETVPKSRIKVAQVKVVPKKGEMDANHQLLNGILQQLEQEHPDVDVVVTSEGFLDGYVSTEPKVQKSDMIRYAIDPATSPYARSVSDWARSHRSWFIFGCTRAQEGRPYNTALIYNRTGNLIGWYDKLHLLQHDHKYEPGKTLDVYQSDFGLFGILICADRRWPETVRTLALKGARVVFNPTYGMHNDLNLCMMRTRAYESEILIVFTHPQQALITDPEGQVLRNDDDDSHRVIVTEIDLAASDVRRAGESGHLRHRRPDVYKL